MIVWITENYLPISAGALAAAILLAALWFYLHSKLKNRLREAEQQFELATQSLNFELEKSALLAHEKADALNQLSQLQQTFSDSRNEIAALQAQLAQLDVLNRRIAEKEQQTSELQSQLLVRETKLAELAAQAEAQAKYHAEQVKLLNENKDRLKQEFSNLANEIFEQKSQSFNQQSKQSMSALLDPFQKQIDQFRQRVDAIHTKDVEGRSQLVAQLDMLKDMNSQLNQQASDLTKALKGDKKLQGNWGELQIERILESSGLQKDREYQREPNFKDEDGKNRRPDFVIHLPDDKHIIIDSKVSLNAYQQAISLEDEGERQKALAEHVAATRTHIRSLSDKNYPSLTGMNAPDFVLMFMPIESAFIAAFEADPQLFNEAFERHIVVVTPTTLLATLKTVANLWVLERQNENAKELFRLAGNIYDKLAVFGQKMDKLGAQIDTAGKTWGEAMGTLRDGRGSMASYVKRLQTLGAPASKKLPSSLGSSELEETDSEPESSSD